MKKSYERSDWARACHPERSEGFPRLRGLFALAPRRTSPSEACRTLEYGRVGRALFATSIVLGKPAPRGRGAVGTGGTAHSRRPPRKVVLVRFFTDPDCPYCSATASAVERAPRGFGGRGLTGVGFDTPRPHLARRPSSTRARSRGSTFSRSPSPWTTSGGASPLWLDPPTAAGRRLPFSSTARASSGTSTRRRFRQDSRIPRRAAYFEMREGIGSPSSPKRRLHDAQAQGFRPSSSPSLLTTGAGGETRHAPTFSSRSAPASRARGRPSSTSPTASRCRSPCSRASSRTSSSA